MITPELLAGVPEFLATCQTYEGGFGNASFPGWAFGSGKASRSAPVRFGASLHLADDTEASRSSSSPRDPTAPRPPLGEAHGGYTFCAAASWVLLQPFIKLYYAHAPGDPLREPQINTRALLRWCVQMQGLHIELGGFKGRTNKLVDGCYSWWVGGCVVLVETLLGTATHHDATDEDHSSEHEHEEDGAKVWDDADGTHGVHDWWKACLTSSITLKRLAYVRLIIQPACSARVHSLCRAASCWRITGQAI